MYSFLVLVMGIAPITAPLIGGQILIYFGWRAIFVALSAFGLLCLLMVWLGLPETLPAERRTQAGFSSAVSAYQVLLRDGRYMGFALAGGLASAAMFAYISGSSFVFIELNGVPPEQFGLLFGLNALGLILASQANRYLLVRYTNLQLLNAALSVTAGASLLLLVVTVLQLGGFAGMLALLFLTIASTGMVQPNSTAAAMAPYGRQAGSASALLGATQFLAGSVAGALVSVLGRWDCSAHGERHRPVRDRGMAAAPSGSLPCPAPACTILAPPQKTFSSSACHRTLTASHKLVACPLTDRACAPRRRHRHLPDPGCHARCACLWPAARQFRPGRSHGKRRGGPHRPVDRHSRGVPGAGCAEIVQFQRVHHFIGSPVAPGRCWTRR